MSEVETNGDTNCIGCCTGKSEVIYSKFYLNFMIFRSFIYARKHERCTDANNTSDSAETDNSIHFPYLSLHKKVEYPDFYEIAIRMETEICFFLIF